LEVFTLKLALLAFWAAWFAIVALTNAFGALKAMGVLPETWRLASGNYAQVAKAVSVYRAPNWVPAFLFAAVIAWQVLASAAFVCAFASSLRAHAPTWTTINLAYGCGIALWAAFMIADELTFKYAYEQSHELLFIAQLASLAAMYLLPG